MGSNIDKYKYIYFSYLERSKDFWGVKSAKSPKLVLFVKIILSAIKNDVIEFFSSKKDYAYINDKIWLYVESINQYNALKSISSLKNTVFVTRSKTICRNNEDVTYLYLKTKLRHRLARLFKRTGLKALFKENYYGFYSLIFLYDGVYEATVDLITNVKPKAIVFSNDHNIYNRNLLLVANEHSIKTIYLQHATVSEKFPPLDFGLNLLEGNDALDKYKKAGQIKGRVELVGMLKFEKYFKYIKKTQKTNLNVIGIALNKTDHLDKYLELIHVLKASFPNKTIIIRPHPGMKLNNKFEVLKGVLFSYSRIEDSFQYINKIDLLISGNSSIHLEAVLLNIPSIQIAQFSEISDDYYGFGRNNLIEIVSENNIADTISTYSNQICNYRNRAKYYNATIDTKWDGNNLEYITKIIQEYLNS